MYISGPFSLSMYRDDTGKTITCFGEIHSSTIDCTTLNIQHFIRIVDYINSIHPEVSIYIETDNHNFIHEQYLLQQDLGALENIVPKENIYLIDIRYDTPFGKLDYQLYQLYTDIKNNQVELDPVQVVDLLEQMLNECDKLYSSGLDEYMMMSLDKELERFYFIQDTNVYKSVLGYIDQHTKDMYMQHINTLLYNIQSFKNAEHSIKSSDSLELLYDTIILLESIGQTIMDIYALPYILMDQNDVVIYVGEFHAELYRKIFEQLNITLIYHSDTQDYDDKCLHVH